jgi:hypothetical protein
MRRRRLSLILVAVLMAAIFGACSSSSQKASTGSESARDSAMAPAAPPASAPAGQPAKPQEAASPASPASNQTGQVSSSPAPIDERKIIRNASFDMKIKDADQTIIKISQAVSASGGYVQETKQSGTKQSGRTINMVLRVPSGQYAPVVDLIRGLGEEVTQQREWTEDVTEQFVDMEQRIKSQEIHLVQLQKLYDKGGSIKEMMELEQEIARVTADLESMKGRLRVLASRVDFSTLIVNLYEPGAPTPIQQPRTVWERMTRGFQESWHAVVNLTGDLAVFTVSAVPILVYLAILGLVLFLIIRGLQRFSNRRRRQGPPPMPEDPHQEHKQ